MNLEMTEEKRYLSAAAVAAALVAVWWGWKILEWIWLKPKRMEKHLIRQGLKGNPYRTLFGDMKDCVAITKQSRTKPLSISDDIVPRILPFVHKNINTYGKKAFMWLGYMPRVHITEPKLVKEILSNNFDYVKPKSNPFLKLLVSGLALCENDQWIKHKKIVNPAFRMERLKGMFPAFHVSCIEMMNEWEKVSKESRVVDVWPYIRSMSADVISRTAFGSSYEEGRKIFQLLRVQAGLVTEALKTVYIPGMRFLPTKRNMRMKQIVKQLDHLIINLINKRVKALRNGEATDEDLLSMLIESNFKVVEEGKLTGMTIKEVIEECKLFYFAGQETSAVLLLWTMILLAQHQQWQHRTREEVFQIFGKDGYPDFDGINRLKIVTMVLNEVLRLYPPIAEMTRVIKKDMKLGSLHFEAGTSFSMPILLFHHDKEIWGDDAKEFKPERFAKGILHATKGNQVSYFPFGWGPRICIGQNFALLEVKIAVAMILQRFSFELSPSYAHAPYRLITLKPQFGAPLILHQL